MSVLTLASKHFLLLHQENMRTTLSAWRCAKGSSCRARTSFTHVRAAHYKLSAARMVSANALRAPDAAPARPYTPSGRVWPKQLVEKFPFLKN